MNRFLNTLDYVYEMFSDMKIKFVYLEEVEYFDVDSINETLIKDFWAYFVNTHMIARKYGPLPLGNITTLTPELNYLYRNYFYPHFLQLISYPDATLNYVSIDGITFLAKANNEIEILTLPISFLSSDFKGRMPGNLVNYTPDGEFKRMFITLYIYVPK